MGKSSLFRGGIWTIGSYGASLGLRFLSNVVLAHILAPEAIGILFIVNLVRLGVELLTDIGIEQNIVHHERGLDPAFLHTAWTVQVLRGIAIGLLFLALSIPLGHFYAVDPAILAAMSLAPLFNSLASVAIFVLVRTLQVRTRNLFELGSELLAFIVTVSLALALRNVWALVLGALAQTLIRAALSYLIPGERMRLAFDPAIMRGIFHFGKWIFLSSFLSFSAANIDRIILARYLPLGLLGIFGLAKIIAEIPATLAGRVSYQILFPAMAAWCERRDPDELRHVTGLRLKFVIVAAIGIAGVAALSDIAVSLIYDARYRAAGWMLSQLLVGAWFAVASGLNEAVLLGLGRPRVTAYSNSIKFAVLVFVLPLALHYHGLPGALIALIAAEMLRFLYLMGRMPADMHLRRQDIMATLLFFATFLLVSGGRMALGHGVAWQGIGG